MDEQGTGYVPESAAIPESERWKSYEFIAEKLGLSADRLRRLLNTKKVDGRKIRKTQRNPGFPFRWVTTERNVAKYLSSKLTPSEYGKKGGRPRKTEIGRRGVVFQASS